MRAINTDGHDHFPLKKVAFSQDLLDWDGCAGATDAFGLDAGTGVVGVIANGLMLNLSVETLTGVITVGLRPSDNGVIVSGFIPFCSGDCSIFPKSVII